MNSLTSYMNNVDQPVSNCGLEALVIAHYFPPNTRLLIKQLYAEADPLTKVEIRHVINNLIEDDISQNALEADLECPESNSITDRLSGSDICHLYEQNEEILNTALETELDHQRTRKIASSLAKHSQKTQPSPIAIKPSFQESSYRFSANTLVQITSSLFVQIANLQSDNKLLLNMRRNNEKLFYSRLCECKLLGGVAQELTHLCWLFTSKKVATLQATLKKYHARRFAALPKLMELL